MTDERIDLLMQIAQIPKFEGEEEDFEQKMQDVLQLKDSRYYYSIIDKHAYKWLFDKDQESTIFVRDYESDLIIEVSSLEEADEIMESLEECNVET